MIRYALTIIVLLLTALCHLGIHRAQDRAGSQKTPMTTFDLPDTIGGFRALGSNADVDKDVLEKLQTSSILIRDYVSDRGRPVQVTIVHAGGHAPEPSFPRGLSRGTRLGSPRTIRRPGGVSFHRKTARAVQWAPRGSGVVLVQDR